MAVLSVPISKASASVSLDLDALPDAVYKLLLAEGAKVMLNKGMSKIILKGLEGDGLAKAKADALTVANKNLDKMMAGEVKAGRSAGTSKIAGVVMTEARRLAKEVVKNELRAANIKISTVEASEITKAANALIEADPSYVETASANIETRKAKAVSINIAGMVHVSPTLLAKAEKEKTERAAARKSAPLSAKQAGKVAPRKGSKPVEASVN